MNVLRVLIVGALLACVVWLGQGCSNVDKITTPDIEGYTTLNVAYGDPGPTPNPCDDLLPFLDGDGQDAEWSEAEPLFVRMTGGNGNGGRDFFLEVRAIWANIPGDASTSQLYFLVRYNDAHLDAKPDQLAYGTLDANGQVVPSPVPADPGANGGECDSVLLSPGSWTRLNADGKEDAVVMMIQEVADDQVATNLVEANGEVLGRVGFQVNGGTTISGVSDTDLWIWRAGRTNLQPVPQFAEWGATPDANGIPFSVFPKVTQTAAFCEDAWIDSGHTLSDDSGTLPFVRNFRDTAVPIRRTECPPTGRGDSGPVVVNAGIPNDLGLWWPKAALFRDCDILACSRLTITPPRWSERLLPGDFDYILGWALQVPSGSQEDVRAKGSYNLDQNKGFPVRTLEIERNTNTGNPDDLVISTDNSRHYRMVVGVLDGSGKVGSGSNEIRLHFDKPAPQPGTRKRTSGGC